MNLLKKPDGINANCLKQTEKDFQKQYNLL